MGCAGTQGQRVAGLTLLSAVDAATNGTVARMSNVHPATFVAFKRWLAEQTEHKAHKRRRDVLQADAVRDLLQV